MFLIVSPRVNQSLHITLVIFHSLGRTSALAWPWLELPVLQMYLANTSGTTSEELVSGYTITSGGGVELQHTTNNTVENLIILLGTFNIIK